MEDAVYMANLLRARACAVCGADRPAVESLLRKACFVCGSAIDDGEPILLVQRKGATPVCSRVCLAQLERGHAPATETCVACGSPWSEAIPAVGSCRVCAADLNLDAGFLGIWDRGRLVPFCGVQCLDRHSARVNPFCG